MRLYVLFALVAVSLALTVHLVPHTHDDVGWLKTVDQYFYGSNNTIQLAGVQYILDSVIPSLENNPSRKFVYVEQAFFQQWWAQQDSSMQQRVKNLVAAGQLEFINGGWCMHDEASTHYTAMVDQTTLGHKYLLDQFNVRPTVGWQIDPFGHSSTHAALLSAQVGFTSLFFARIDYQDYQQRTKNKQMEMIWRASPSYGASAQVFTGAFVTFYCPPSGFDWDYPSNDAPIIDDPNVFDYNVKYMVDLFVNQSLQVSSQILGDDIMFLMGCDFEYSNANTWYKNLDKLIKYVTQDGRVKVKYSTPSIYYQAKMASNLTWPLKTDDFFPYADNSHSYWTGYFTSRPSLKRHERWAGNILQNVKQIASLSGGNNSTLLYFQQAHAVVQHHDGVSGTSKQHVAYDYATRLAKGRAQACKQADSTLGSWVNKTSPPAFALCPLRNESYCPTSQNNNNFAIVVYNAMARARTEYIRVPINSPSVLVLDYQGKNAVYQVLDNPATPVYLDHTPSPYTLVIQADLPALGYTTYVVQRTAQESPYYYPTKPTSVDADQLILENAAIQLVFSQSSGKLQSILNKQESISASLQQEFLYYTSFEGNMEDYQNSGAYIFRPNDTQARPVDLATPTLKLVQGNLIQEVRQSITSYITQTVRLEGDSPYVVFDYNVGDIPIDDSGKEVISRFTSNLATYGTFYTDSNGREMQTRIKDYRPTWSYTITEPVAGNYYPVNAFITLKDTVRQLTVLNDRSQGGASLNDGDFELMVHRRTLQDDYRGVDEPMNETQGITPCAPYGSADRIGVGMGIRGTHTLLLNKVSTASSNIRPLQDRLFYEPYVSFAPIANVNSFLASPQLRLSFNANPLPANVQLMTLEPWRDGTILLRLSHQFGVGEDATLSQPVTVDLAGLFSGFNLTNAVELTLTANGVKSSSSPNPNANVKVHETYENYKGVSGAETEYIRDDSGLLRAVLVTLGPMDIKTFQITLV